MLNLLAELIARKIQTPEDWYNFEQVFPHVCNKLLNNNEMDYFKITKPDRDPSRVFGYQKENRKLLNGKKHGPEHIFYNLYTTTWINGKQHGRETEKQHNTHYLKYESDWKFGKQHGWEIEYWGNSYGSWMQHYCNGIKHGLQIFYITERRYADKPYGFAIWKYGKKILEKDYFDVIV